MANVLSDEKKQQVLALGRLGWPLRRIEQTVGVRRETAAAYLRAAGVAVRAPRTRRPPPESKPASEVITDPATDPPWPPAARSPAASACEPYREVVERALALRRNATAIYQDLVTDHGFAAGYASVMRFVRKLRGAQRPDAHAVIVTDPGEEAQVDYGEGPMVRHPETGKYRRTRLFVLTLGYSRKAVRLLVWRSSSRVWAELHEQAFRRLGGATRVLVLDNLREGVLTPDVYDPTVNPLFRDVLAHYGVVALPCRVRDPDRKGKVERSVGHAQATPLRGLRFESIDEAQAHLDRWEARWADTRIHGTTKRQVAAMFAEEQPHLRPLPVEPFRYYQHGDRTVHLDGHVEIDGAYYSVPAGRIGERLPVQWDERRVRILDRATGQLLVEHARQAAGRYRTRDEDRPMRTPPMTRHLLDRAFRTGRHVGTLCRRMHEQDGEIAVRRILGVLHLGRTHGATALERACTAALEMNVPTYRFVRRWLEHRPPEQLTLRQVDPLIRELTHYRDVIRRRTETA